MEFTIHIWYSERKEYYKTDYVNLDYNWYIANIDRYNNWSYKNLFNGGGIDFSMSSQDGKVDCGFTFNREDYHIYESLSYIIDLDVNRAIDKVSNVKRRVRTLFDNNKGSN